ncbi:retrotransposon protein, putative, unclassified [Panicum miliaceum]|uniref:Retrotransposon protein, putative, unclassified n=1 Tax=Panicum miliaceum TaxID=4540 RepID=A0A3L6T556_PANMI|nr:retrotransposon protein, putative, unclassified [Panicum miliaceum]
MVFILLMEFMAPNDRDKATRVEEQMAQLVLKPMTATFEKPEEEKRQHLKALFLKGYVNERPVSRLLVDGGAAVNIMPYAMFRKLGKSDEDLTKTDMMLKDFEGNVSPAHGALCVDLTIGSKTLPTTFFVINGKGSYNMLLGRDWIHANCCVPSTMHQCLVQWVGDSTEIITADSAYNVAAADPQQWSCEHVRCISGRTWDTDFLKVSDFGLQPIQAVGSEDSE